MPTDLTRCPPCLLQMMEKLRRRPDFPEVTPYRVEDDPLAGTWILSTGRRFGDNREEPPPIYWKKEDPPAIQEPEPRKELKS